MIMTPDFERFQNLARKGNLVPVFSEHLADLETPVSALARFAHDDNVFLLESVEGGERWGRFSILGVNVKRIFKVSNGSPMLRESDGTETVLDAAGNPPLFALREVMKAVKPVEIPELPRFFGGAIGYIGYETVNEFERLPPPRNPLDHPTSCLALADDLVVFDNVRHTLKVVAYARIDDHPDLESAYAEAEFRIRAIEARLNRPIAELADSKGEGGVELESNMDRETFCEMVRRAKKYIVAGDIIQTVLSQRFSARLESSPLALYRALRLINPSPYLFFLKFNDHMLVGSSPEIMVRLTGSSMELRPIAGTRPRGSTEQEDRALADELIGDEKERAEHVMLVDLGRNDLGRVAQPGSVQVRDFMTIERYSHVMHIVSDVHGELKPEHDAFDLLKATFPAGTLSGAPKIRAMEIIRELEPTPRGTYGGAVGYIAYNGDMDLAITIRTLEVESDRVSVQAGAGIVADSDPDSEYEETRNKARGMLRALEMARRGLKI